MTSIARACAALVLLAACAAGLVAAAPAEASTPPLIWNGVARINVLCLVQTDAGIDHGALDALVCGKARDIAAAGAPAQVAIVAPGDPAVLAPDRVTLLVHASVQGDQGHRLIVFTVRPFRAAEPMLFSAAPRAVPLAGPSGPAPQFEAALAAALSETLPWLSRPAGARPIR